MRPASDLVARIVAIAFILASCGGEVPEAEATSSSASVPAATDPCALLTASEIEAATGVVPGSAERPDPNVNMCQWTNPDSPFPVAGITLSPQSIGSWEAYRTGMIENGLGDPDADGERIDIGRFGHYHASMGMIQVQTDRDVLLTLIVPGTRRDPSNKAQVIDLAGKAIARIR